MYETHFLIKMKAGRKAGSRTISMIAEVELEKIIYGAKYVEVILSADSKFNNNGTIISCDLVDDSCFYTNVDEFGNIHEEAFRSNSCLMMKTIVPDNKKLIKKEKETIRDFFVEVAIVDKGGTFNPNEIKASMIHLVIYHTFE